MVRILRVIEVVRYGKLVCIVQLDVSLRKESLIIDLVLDRLSFFLVARGPEEIDQSQSLAIVVTVD